MSRLDVSSTQNNIVKTLVNSDSAEKIIAEAVANNSFAPSLISKTMVDELLTGEYIPKIN